MHAVLSMLLGEIDDVIKILNWHITINGYEQG